MKNYARVLDCVNQEQSELHPILNHGLRETPVNSRFADATSIGQDEVEHHPCVWIHVPFDTYRPVRLEAAVHGSIVQVHLAKSTCQLPIATAGDAARVQISEKETTYAS